VATEYCPEATWTQPPLSRLRLLEPSADAVIAVWWSAEAALVVSASFSSLSARLDQERSPARQPAMCPPKRVHSHHISTPLVLPPLSTPYSVAMGIPVGWNITRDDAKDKDVLRADVTGQRSPIRRRPRSTRSPTALSAFDTDFLVATSRFSPLAGPISRPSLSHARTRLPPAPPVPDISRSRHDSSPFRSPPRLLRESSTLRRLRADSEETLQPLPDSYDAHLARTPAALTPGFAPAAAARSPEPLPDVDIDDTSSARNSSPYRRRAAPRRHAAPRHYPWSDRPARMRTDDATAFDEADDTINDQSAVSFPPLRRMGRRTIIADGPLPSSSLRESWSPASTFDGLGDRDRSVSPFDSHLPWETFLSTVVPDPVAPTAESSFASAAASASFSTSNPSSRAGSSNSAYSSRTHLTVPSRRPSSPPNEQFLRACDTSDDDTASETEEEVPTNPIRRRRMRPSYFTNEPPERDSERYSRRVLERSRDASAYVRRFYYPEASHNEEDERHTHDQLDGPIDEPADEPIEELGTTGNDEDAPPLLPLSSPLDQELRDARSLLEQLTRRADVSDDFWASVGLTRSFADGVERVQERERF
jgi:hypothetical protein